MSNWYQLEAQQVVQDLNTDASTGLTQNEVSRRLQSGVNELAERGLKSPWQIIWEQLTASTVVILLVAALVSTALSVEPAEQNIMNRPPHNPKENIFGRGMGWEIIWIGLMLGLLCLGIGYWYWQIDHESSWQTMLFTVLTFSEIAIALALRSERDSLFQIGLFSNPQLLAAVVLTFGLQLAVIYVPFLQEVFLSKPLSLRDLALSLVVSTTVFWFIELKKLIIRRKLVQNRDI